MKTIVVGFCKPKAFFVPFSWAIRAVLGTPFSHTYIKFRACSLDRNLIYQASGTEVNFISENRFIDKESVIAEFEIQISDEVFTKTIQLAVDQSGVPYGVRQIIGMLLVQICKVFNIKIKNPLSNGTHTFVCSELVALILKEVIGLNVDYDLDSITPKEVYEIMAKHKAEAF